MATRQGAAPCRIERVMVTHFHAVPGIYALLWNSSQALALFNALKNGQTVPSGLLSGTTVG